MLHSNIVKAFIAQVLIFGINIITGFVFTPYILNKIGAEAYAFYPLSFNIINYASSLTVIFTYFLSKYVTVDYFRGDFKKVNAFFNSSLFGNIIVGTLIIIPMIFISLNTDKIFNVPEDLFWEVRLLFVFITLSFFVAQIVNTFVVANIATDKRYLTNFEKAAERTVMLITALILFNLFKPSLWQLGLAVLAGIVLRFVITVKIQKKIMPGIVISKKLISVDMTKMLIAGSFWYALNQLSALLFTNIEIMLANLKFGYEVQSDYALALVIPNLFRSMIIFITNAILPFLAILLKNKDFERISNSVPRFVKCMALFIAGVVSVTIGFGDVFLKLWIPEFYDVKIYILMSISLLSVAVTGAMSIGQCILTVYNRVRFPASVMLILAVINIPLALFFSEIFGIYGILISSVVINSIGFLIFIPIYIKKVINFNIKSLYNSLFKAFVVLVSGISICSIIKLFFNIESYLKLSLCILAVLIILILTAFIWLLSIEDISFIIDIIRYKINYGKDANEFQSRNYDSFI